MKIIRIIASCMAALLVSLSSWAQDAASAMQDAGFITLYGHVSDKGTSESLFFSSINLKGTNTNNVSNSDGFFSLKLPEGISPDAELQISHLGYQTKSVAVSAFDGSTSDKPLEIKLISSPIQLDPATVRMIDPEVLVRSAFYKVKDNYPSSRVGLTAFYREMIRKGTAKYLALNEAVIDIDKAPYSGLSSDKVGIYKGRGSENYDSTDTLFVKLQGGIITALELDQVRHPFAGVSLHEITKIYAFSVEGVETYDGYSFYKVGFKPHPSVEEIYFKGYLYIETESLAIGRVELEMDLVGREEEAAKIFVLKSPAHTRFYTDQAKYLISYKCFDGKWYYDYCRGDLNFSTRKKNSMFKKNFSVTLEMAVTDHKDGGIAIMDVSRVKFKDILSDRVADFADENFWGENNIIEPDQSIDAIIKRIVRQLNNRR